MSERRQPVNLAYRLLGSLAHRVCRAGDLRPLVCHDPSAAGSHRISRRLAEQGRQPHLPQRARVGAGRGYRGPSSRPPARSGRWASGRPGQPAAGVPTDGVGQHGVPGVLESMTPAERVALILHDVFAYPFGEVAEITGRTPVACRQLASSARRRAAPRSLPPPPPRQASIVRDFKEAWEAKDIGALIGLLDPGAIVTGDGGGLAPAALSPIEGGEQVARYLADLARAAPGNVTLLERTVSGQPGLVAQQDSVTVAVYAFEAAGGHITRIWAILNPSKLRPWSGRLIRAAATRLEPNIAASNQGDLGHRRGRGGPVVAPRRSRPAPPCGSPGSARCANCGPTASPAHQAGVAALVSTSRMAPSRASISGAGRPPVKYSIQDGPPGPRTSPGGQPRGGDRLAGRAGPWPAAHG